MANKKKKNFVVEEDESSVDVRYIALKSLGYLFKNMWERNDKTLTLSSDEEYTKYIFCEKQEFLKQQIEYNSDRDKTIMTDLYQVSGRESLISAVYSFSGSDVSDNNQDHFVSVYYLGSSKTEKVNNEKKVLNFVQLCRYDPVEKHEHLNNFSNFQFDENSNEENLYLYYFGKKVKAPHFHFASRRNAENLGKASGLAIDLDMLIEYLEDLNDGEKNHPDIEKYNLGLPFLEIKKNPSMYKTSVERKNIPELCKIITKSDASKRIVQNLLTSPRGKVEGVYAVITDLLVLKALHDDRGSPRVMEMKLAAKIMCGKIDEPILDDVCEELVRQKSERRKREERGRFR